MSEHSHGYPGEYSTSYARQDVYLDSGFVLRPLPEQLPSQQPDSGTAALKATILASKNFGPGGAIGEADLVTDSVIPSPEEGYSDPFDTAEVTAKTPAVATMLRQGWVREASTVKEILADPEKMAKCESETLFAWRPPETFWEDQSEGTTHAVEMTTEADALRDFDTQMQRLHGVYKEQVMNAGFQDREYWSKKLNSLNGLRNGLRFIPAQDLQAACDTFADYWLARLESGKDIYVSYTPYDFQGTHHYKSNHLVLTKILESFQQRHNPDNALSERIRLVKPADVEDSEVREQVIRNGLVFVDDWSVSGIQTATHVRYFSDIPSYAKQINFVCAPGNHIEQNIAGARVKSYFKRPKVYGNARHFPSLTGSHSDTDYGFRETIGTLYNLSKHIPEDYQDYPFPLLYRIARAYRPDDYLKHLPAGEQRDILEERSEAFRICAAALLQRTVQAKSPW